jgi:hypothetical protein
MEAVLLRGGGHIAELRLVAPHGPPVNCLWAAPWLTADPGDAEFETLAEKYGSAPVGKFLAGYTGHALCLDIFGLPSEQDAARGVPLHGEASAREWTFDPIAGGCVGRVELPVAQLGFERRITLAENAAAVFVEERLENRGALAREIHWVQHLSLGPPFLAPGESTVHASLDRAAPWPLGYEGREMLRSDVEFQWPLAPSVDGGLLDLRSPFQRPGYGFVVAARVENAGEFACIAALNCRLGLALVYCFRKRDFPWVAVWEENCARSGAPWSGAAQVRGMEFGTTPMPTGRDDIHALGNLFDTPCSRILDEGGVLHARYLAAIAAVPVDWREVADVVPGRDTLTLFGARNSEPVILAVEGVDHFLHEGAGKA